MLFNKMTNILELDIHDKNKKNRISNMSNDLSKLIKNKKKLREVSKFWICSMEKEVKLAAKDFIKKGDTIFDVGSHVGGFSIPISKFMKESGKIFSFEPNKNVYDVLVENVKYNKIKNIVPINKVVSRYSSNNVSFYVDKSCEGFRTSLNNENKYIFTNKNQYKKISMNSILSMIIFLKI
jgi:FkbM family methyltransferase